MCLAKCSLTHNSSGVGSHVLRELGENHQLFPEPARKMPDDILVPFVYENFVLIRK